MGSELHGAQLGWLDDGEAHGGGDCRSWKLGGQQGGPDIAAKMHIAAIGSVLAILALVEVADPRQLHPDGADRGCALGGLRDVAIEIGGHGKALRADGQESGRHPQFDGTLLQHLMEVAALGGEVPVLVAAIVEGPSSQGLPDKPHEAGVDMRLIALGATMALPGLE